MSALQQDRNTKEIYCNVPAIHRVRSMGSEQVYAGSICAVNARGVAVPASDSAGLVVIGRCETYLSNGKIIAKSGAFVYDCSGNTNEALTEADLNHVVYILDDHTVGKNGGTNKIPAGVLRDIISPTEVVVEIGNLAIF